MAGEVAAVQTAADGMGISEELVSAVLAAVTASGQELAPISGGTPAAATASVPGVRKSVDGMPGHFVCSAEISTGVFKWWLEVVNPKSGTVERVALA